MVGVNVEEGGEPLARPRLLSPPLLSANAASTPPPSAEAAVMSGAMGYYDEVGSCQFSFVNYRLEVLVYLGIQVL